MIPLDEVRVHHHFLGYVTIQDLLPPSHFQEIVRSACGVKGREGWMCVVYDVSRFFFQLCVGWESVYVGVYVCVYVAR